MSPALSLRPEITEMTYTRFVTDLISSSPQKPENLSNLAVEIEKPTTHEPLSLAVQCAKIIKQNYDLKNLSSYPDTVQQKVLQQADNFKEWVALKAYMDYDVLQHSAKDWLQKEGISYTPLDRKRYTAEEKLLGHLFDQKITSKLSSIEQPVLEQLIQKKRGIASSLQASALKVQTLAEKIQDLFIQKILLNKYFYYPAGAALGLYVGLKSIQVIWNAHQLFLVKILPQALEIAKKHIPTPVKEAALATYQPILEFLFLQLKQLRAQLLEWEQSQLAFLVLNGVWRIGFCGLGYSQFQLRLLFQQPAFTRFSG